MHSRTSVRLCQRHNHLHSAGLRAIGKCAPAWERQRAPRLGAELQGWVPLPVFVRCICLSNAFWSAELNKEWSRCGVLYWPEARPGWHKAENNPVEHVGCVTHQAPTPLPVAWREITSSESAVSTGCVFWMIRWATPHQIVHTYVEEPGAHSSMRK
eukprot:gene13563-biopygen15595